MSAPLIGWRSTAFPRRSHCWLVSINQFKIYWTGKFNAIFLLKKVQIELQMKQQKKTKLLVHIGRLPYAVAPHMPRFQQRSKVGTIVSVRGSRQYEKWNLLSITNPNPWRRWVHGWCSDWPVYSAFRVTLIPDRFRFFCQRRKTVRRKYTLGYRQTTVWTKPFARCATRSIILLR